MNIVSDSKTQVARHTAPTLPVTTSQVISADGNIIGYHQVGSGPGLVVLHGGMRAGHHYLRLANGLADCFTVTLPDRRGRGLSGPRGVDYSIEKEMDDILAILQKTGAGILFGHSAGGFFALEAALRFPVQKVTAYEPAVSIHGSLPFGWLPAFQQALAKKDYALAMIQVIRGLQLSAIGRLPDWVLLPFARLMLRDKDGQELPALLPTLSWEAQEFQRLEKLGLTYERYANISAETLLIDGTNSPTYLRDAARVLSTTLPRARLVELAGLDHNAPDQNAPELVSAALAQFLA